MAILDIAPHAAWNRADSLADKTKALWSSFANQGTKVVSDYDISIVVRS
jgi:hypothetical protein